MEKMKFESVDITKQNIEKIGGLFPNCITEATDEKGVLRKAVNFEILKQMLSDEVVDGDEAYEFTWVGKKAAIVEANKPIRKTLRPCPEESVDWDNTENLYIEGDNLEVLKLLQESYLGAVKMIYIDPPYNTGNDFIYRDDFAMSNKEFENRSGDLDEETGDRLYKNTDTNGRFHSDWCSMMYSRLLLARNLLSEDGVIFISIDDNEQENLKKICDEVFGIDNILSTLIWDLGTGTTAGHFARGHEYILCYGKNKKCIPNFKNYNKDEIISHGALKKISNKNPAVEITFPIGFEFEGDNAVFKGEIGDSEKEYILSEEMVFKEGKLISPVTIKAGFAMRNQVIDFINGREVFDTKGQKVNRFYFNSKGILFYEKEKTVINPRTVISNLANTKNGTTELNAIFNNLKLFDFPKPSALIKYLSLLVTEQNDIILDFFSGSATTAHAVMQLNAEDGGNRKFIMVQLPEPCDEKSEAYKAGYKNICEIGKERIRRAGKVILGNREQGIGNSVEIGNREQGIGNSVEIGIREQGIGNSVEIGIRERRIGNSVEMGIREKVIGNSVEIGNREKGIGNSVEIGNREKGIGNSVGIGNSSKRMVSEDKNDSRLSGVDCLAKVNGNCRNYLLNCQKAAEGGVICPLKSDEEGGSIDTVKYSGGKCTKFNEGICAVLEHSEGFKGGIRDTTDTVCPNWISSATGNRRCDGKIGSSRENVEFNDKKTSHANTETLIPNPSSLIPKIDTGFRVLKLADTNMTDVYYAPAEYSQDQLSMFESNIKSDRTDLDLLFGCLLEWGKPLSLPYTSEDIEGFTVHTYNDDDGDLIACFDENVSDSVIKEIAKRQPKRAVFRDRSFADSPSKINVEEVFKLLAPATKVNVI